MPDIRAAQIEDASALAAISIEVWVATYQRNGVGSFFADYVLSTFTAVKMRALIENPEERVFVCDSTEGLVGYVRLSLHSTGAHPDCTGAEIATLYVQPRHHGKRIGAALLDAAHDAARESGATSVWLTTNSENAPAIAFYNALGFAHVGETEYPIGDRSYTNHVFTKSLS